MLLNLFSKIYVKFNFTITYIPKSAFTSKAINHFYIIFDIAIVYHSKWIQDCEVKIFKMFEEHI